MPASQLKRLKASLRDQGVTGPQKSKKQKKAQKGRPANERVERNAALQNIRDSFNPFELRQSARPDKFPSASSKNANNGVSGKYKAALHRPGVTKSAGEEMRRATLLPEMQRRNKTGGLIDRRIGEGDVGMTPEERALERFTREKQRKKGGSLFDLEASDDEGGVGLTHGGRRLDELEGDDFSDAMSGGSDEEADGELMRRKRRREDIADEEEAAAGEQVQEPQPERKKTKKEVMEEVIAKSKLHKYERQKAKEDDEDIREELDKGIGDMLALLKGHKPPPKPEQAGANGATGGINPDRQALIDGADRVKADKEYDARLRQYAQDTRAKPSERTKTEEEKLLAEALRLKELEEKRAKRMRGEEVSDEEAEEEEEADEKAEEAVKRALAGDEDIGDEAADFGFSSSIAQPKKASREEPAVQPDEDEFALDEDLIASGSDVDLSSESGDEGSESGSEGEEQGPEEDEEDEFVQDVLGDNEKTGANSVKLGEPGATSRVAYTFPCPRSHEELLEVAKEIKPEELPTVVQRVRALHHPSLSADNKEAMADFSKVLVDHIAYMGDTKQSLVPTEQLIRHLHSLSRSYPTEIAAAFRKHLQTFHERGHPTAGDVIILTAIGSIYPTSDHFHQVVTPAITLMARFLGMTSPTAPAAQTYGVCMVHLCLSYQKLSKRYLPEAVRFTLRALAAKPTPSAAQLQAHLDNITTMADLWQAKSSFPEIFAPFLPILQIMPSAKKILQHLKILLSNSNLNRRPLTLHTHKPLAIRQSIPKFEESFDPTKHYDPDKERSDAAKLQKEYKRERKGALRELRKDANFVAREQLREKRERDAAYEKKYRRLVAEIQGEEGRESKGYEREKRMRKSKR